MQLPNLADAIALLQKLGPCSRATGASLCYIGLAGTSQKESILTAISETPPDYGPLLAIGLPAVVLYGALTAFPGVLDWPCAILLSSPLGRRQRFHSKATEVKTIREQLANPDKRAAAMGRLHDLRANLIDEFEIWIAISTDIDDNTRVLNTLVAMMEAKELREAKREFRKM